MAPLRQTNKQTNKQPGHDFPLFYAPGLLCLPCVWVRSPPRQPITSTTPNSFHSSSLPAHQYEPSPTAGNQERKEQIDSTSRNQDDNNNKISLHVNDHISIHMHRHHPAAQNATCHSPLFILTIHSSELRRPLIVASRIPAFAYSSLCYVLSFVCCVILCLPQHR